MIKSFPAVKYLFVIMFFFTGPVMVIRLHAQTRSEGPWWPDKLWGANDQSGGSNWIISMKPCMVGSDASLDAGPEYMLHKEAILENGIFNLEYMNFETLPPEKQQYRFLFIFTPLRLKGATGSPGRPLAIY